MSPENTGKYKTFSVFSVPIKKGATKNDKNGNETVVTISYKIKFIDSARFMASSLSTLVHYHLKEVVPKIKCKDCSFLLNMTVPRTP